MEIFSSGIQFEDYVKHLLNSICIDNETVERYVPRINNKHIMGHYPDFVLKNGCKALGLKKDCYVEVKWRISDTVVRNLIRFCSHNPKISLVVILHHAVFMDESYDPFKGKDIRFIHVSDLQKAYEDMKQEEIGLHNAGTDADAKDDAILTLKSENKSYVFENDDNTDAIELAKRDFIDGNVTLFLGAGVSASAQLPNWDNLLGNLLTDIVQKPLDKDDYRAINVASFNSPIIAARYLLSPFDISKTADRIKITSLLKEALYPPYSQDSSDLIETIVKMCAKRSREGYRSVGSIITMNYDDLIEIEMAKQGLKYESLSKAGKFYGNDTIPIIHVHGVLNRNEVNVDVPVLSEDAYHNLYRKTYHWSNVEMLNAFNRTTCIFIGLSMSDPNLRRLLEFANAESEQGNIHYAILPKRTLQNHNWDSANPIKYYQTITPKEKEFINRQEVVFSNLGVKVIWYEDKKYEQIPLILKRIAQL